MPRCYLLTLCASSAVDKTTNNWSLFHLIEQLGLEPSDPGDIERGEAAVPLEVHSHWKFEEEELGQDYEFRLMLNDGAVDHEASRLFEMKSEKQRHRFRIQGLQIPFIGTAEMRVEWRQQGAQDWQQEPLFWPIQINLAPGGEAAES